MQAICGAAFLPRTGAAPMRCSLEQEAPMIDWTAPTRHKHPGTRRAVAAIAGLAAVSMAFWTALVVLLS